MISTSRLIWVELVSGGNTFKAFPDLRSGITVLRKELIPAVSKLQRVAKVCLRGAFGHAAQADLMYVPLGLKISVRGAALS